MTMSYDAFLSRAAEAMQQSPIRKMGTIAAQRTDLISFAPGYPGPDSFAWDDYRAIVDRLLVERDDGLLQYGPTHGLHPLLEAFVDLLANRGIASPLENLLVTTGSQQGLDLVARTLLDPGDVVLLELPSYTGAIAAFRNVQATLAGVRQHADGIDTDDVCAYQPYWAVRAHLLQRLGRTPEAKDAYDRAIGLTEDPGVKEFLLQRRG